MTQSEPEKPTSAVSVQKASNQYQTKWQAKNFASTVVGTPTDRREKKCVEKCLDLTGVPKGASVLDLPCGAGRLLPLLKKRGFRITGADVSPSMLEQARLYAGPEGENCLEQSDELRVANIMETGFRDKQFDAVVSHRLFQYFPESQVRRQALKELKRISSGPIIVSFLCSWSVDSIQPYIKKLLGRKISGCVPISCTTFADDIRDSGLVVERWIAMRPFISKRWYVLMRPDTADAKSSFLGAYKSILWAAIARLATVAVAALLLWYAASVLK